MKAAMRLASILAGSSLGRDIRIGARQAGRRVGIAVAAVLSGVSALACALAALWIAMLPLVGSWGAPLIVSLVLLLISLTGWLVLRRKVRKAPSAVAASGPTGDFQSSFNDNKLLFLLAAAFAGFTSAQRQDQQKQKG